MMRPGSGVIYFFLWTVVLMYALPGMCSEALQAADDEKPHHVRYIKFITEPPGAEVYIQSVASPHHPSYLGRSGAPLRLDLSVYQGDSYIFIFRLKFYREKRESIRTDDIDVEGVPETIREDGRERTREVVRFPEEGKIYLKPDYPVIIPFYYYVKIHPLNFVGFMVALCAIAMSITPWIREHVFLKRHTAFWEALSAMVDTSDPMYRKRFGVYDVVEKIGAGGMATVYRAIHKDALSDGKSVAIKVMHPERHGEADFARRFKREVQICSRLNHPNVLRILDYGDREGTLYMVMEFIRGKTLAGMIGGRPMSTEAFMKIFIPILEGVEYAHKKEIIHRDLKPENIMIAADGRIVVMDFGLARGEGYSQITATGQAFGTPAYISPEQVSGGSSQITAKADQYSLGVIAYHMLSGRLPFWDESTVNIIFKHVSEAPPPLGDLRPDLPGEFEQVIMRMLEKEPEKRYRDLSEVRIALKETLREKPVR